VGEFFFELLDLKGYLKLFFVRLITNKINGQKDKAHGNGEKNHGDTHVRLGKQLANDPVETDKDIEERLINVESKEVHGQGRL
jgi:hypothetical protein